MTRVPLGDYFCGVLARDPSTYDFLAALDLPPPIRRARTAPLDPAYDPRASATPGQLRLPDHRQRRDGPAAARAARGHSGLGRHRRPAHRSRRLDLAEHARAAATRPAARRTEWPDERPVAQRAGRLHGHAARSGRAVAGQQLAAPDRSRRARRRRPGWRAADRGLEGGRWHGHLSRLRADRAQLPAVERQRRAVALPDHACRRRQRRRLGAGAAVPALGRPGAASGDGRLLDAAQAVAGLVLGADRRCTASGWAARCSCSAAAAWSAGGSLSIVGLDRARGRGGVHQSPASAPSRTRRITRVVVVRPDRRRQ